MVLNEGPATQGDPRTRPRPYEHRGRGAGEVPYRLVTNLRTGPDLFPNVDTRVGKL